MTIVIRGAFAGIAGAGEGSQVEQARRILLEGPHRRASPEAPQRGPSLSGSNEVLIPFKERDTIFELLQPLFEALPELVVHYRLS
ncbi:hypothetical protein CDS [Bradyrhizobium sp.]|nr:hypothetical protein [Bradyrhizobium sp.]CUU13926.1 hypothetical protein CDS [Bradyrhizobium sp.]